MNDRQELARLLPGPVERDLPSGRSHHLQEFVMSEIHRDLRRPVRRRPLRLATTAVAATAVAAVVAAAVVAGVGAGGDPGDGTVPTTSSGQQILLAAAATAQRQPEGAAAYWHVKIISRDAEQRVTWELENWFDREGRSWLRSGKTGDKVVEVPGGVKYTLGRPEVGFDQLQNLPTTPDALKTWIIEAANTVPPKDPSRPLTAQEKDRRVLYGLISVVSQLPAPPKVRAAAFQAIAAYPNVTSLGPVEGGQGLRISFAEDWQVRLVIDPVAAQVRETDLFVTPGGALHWSAEGGSVTLHAEWTDSLPG
jgi:hypothetical protein